MTKSEDETYYHDDPADLDPGPTKKKISSVLAFALLLVGGGFFVQTTLAANISLNAGVPVQFGQGTLQTTSCSGAPGLVITPHAAFNNSSGGGAYYFDSVTVSGIPDSCYGKKFTIKAYSNTDTSLAIFNSTSTTAVIIDKAGTFVLGPGASGMSISSGSGTFTLTFNSPVALSSTVKKITLESSGTTCAEGGICIVGDTGPGGGSVFYVDNAGFSCGATYSITGSPIGGLCYYLEAAPSGWANNGIPADDPEQIWANQNTDVVNLSNDASAYNNAAGIGRGYKNSLAIVAQNGVYDASTNNYAAGAARAYLGGSNSDWYLPTTAELNQICKWTKGLAFTSIATVCTSAGVVNSGLGAAGFVEYYYWTSSERDASSAWLQTLSGAQNPNAKSDSYYVRPIRAF